MQKKFKNSLDNLLHINTKTSETIELLKIIEKELISNEDTKNLLTNRPANQITDQINEVTAYRLLVTIVINQLTEESTKNSSNIHDLYDIYENKYRPDLK